MHFNIQDSLLGNGDEPEESKLWLYVDFIKPGKQTFCVRQRDELYVHKFLCQSRDEDIPKSKNFWHNPFSFLVIWFSWQQQVDWKGFECSRSASY